MKDGSDTLSPLERSIHGRLERRQASSTLRNLTIAPENSVDFSSNDFLSLSTSPALRAAFFKELSREGPGFRLGSGGSRLLDGNSTYAENLERDIARFHNAPAGLLCNSGFDANAGLFACIPQPGDVIVYDQLIHASVHDGMKTSRAGRRLAFPHNSVAELESILRQLLASDDLLKEGRRNVFVAIEAVYSMDGDLAPVAEIVGVVERLLPLKNGHIMIDEAHATGVLGPKGRGLVCELGLEDKIFARIHTFGKSLACGGAIILCSPLVRHYLINYARTVIYTTFMPFPSLAAIRAAYQLLGQGHTEPLAAHLRDLVHHLFERLLALSEEHEAPNCFDQLIRVPLEQPMSPIFWIITPYPRSLAKHCQEGGFVVRPVVPPTVPPGSQRIRVCLHAGNTRAEIDRLIERIDDWLRNNKGTIAADVQPTGQAKL